MLDLKLLKLRDRSIRIFVSSTFRDMKDERKHLGKVVFYVLRKLCQTRGVEFTEVDLRWGVTEEQVQQGKVIKVCLQQIDHCRPFFIGILGDRYGWIPDPDEYKKHKKIIEDFSWVEKDIEDRLSITEMEIQYGVLRNPSMESRAFFYFRDSSATPDEYREQPNSEAAIKLEKLKSLIKSGDIYPWSNFASPMQLEEQISKDFKEFLDKEFPEGEKPSPLERTRLDHAVFAQSRLKLYIGGEEYVRRLDDHVNSTDKPLVVTGESGSGKSALLANWIARYEKAYPEEFILYHFTGGAPDSSDHYGLVRRIMEEMKERFKLDDEIPTDNDKIIEELPLFLAKTPHSQKWVLVIDALNQLEDKDNARWLGWLPEFIPENIRVIFSTLPGEALDSLRKRGYPEMEVRLLDEKGCKVLIEKYLDLFGKTLPDEYARQISADPKSWNPLILRTILDELRIFGVHEELHDRIEYYLRPDTPIGFFVAVLKRLEDDYEDKRPGMVGEMLSLIWASRRGLSESELLEITGIAPLFWAPLYNALEGHLVKRAGLLDFFHDFLRQAVETRYLKDDGAKKHVHVRLADYFGSQKGMTLRKADEWPWNLLHARKHQDLVDILIDIWVLLPLAQLASADVLSYWRSLSSQFDIVQLYETAWNRIEGTTNYSISLIVTKFADTVGRILEGCGLWSDAATFYERFMSRRMVEHNSQGLSVQVARRNYASCLIRLGKYTEAESPLSTALKELVQLTGAYHPDVLDTASDLALVLRQKGDLDGAQNLHRWVLDASLFGVRPSQSACRYAIAYASFLQARNENEKALQVAEEAAGSLTTILGADAYETLLAKFEVGMLKCKLGDYDDGRLMLSHVATTLVRLLGAEHPQAQMAVAAVRGGAQANRDIHPNP